LPYKHLKAFYASIGFQEIQATEATVCLAERLEEYLSLGHANLIIMVMKNR
jgi:hypothetical protein